MPRESVTGNDWSIIHSESCDDALALAARMNLVGLKTYEYKIDKFNSKKQTFIASLTF